MIEKQVDRNNNVKQQSDDNSTIVSNSNNNNNNNNKKKPKLTNVWDGDTYIYYGGKVYKHDKKKIARVVVPASVQKIEDQAFERCDSLTTVECLSSTSPYDQSSSLSKPSSIPSSTTRAETSLLKEIGNRAFFECKSLTSIILPPSLERIGKRAFRQCRRLVAFGTSASSPLSLPESLRVIERDAFTCCAGLTGVEFPKSLIALRHCAFFSCTGLTYAKFSNETTTLEKIGCSAFTACSNLQTVELPDCTKILESQSFYRCTNLSSIRLPALLDKIEMLTFAHCTSLEHIDIPSSTTKIGTMSFQQSGLRHVKLPNSIEEICCNAFGYCADLEKVELGSCTRDIPVGAFRDCTSLKCINLPNTVEYIGARAFSGCSDLTTVHPFSSPAIKQQNQHHEQEETNAEVQTFQLIRIDDKAFIDCIALETIQIPNEIERVGYNAFANCRKLSLSLSSLLSSLFSSSFPLSTGRMCLADREDIAAAADALRFICDLNRGGRKFLLRNDDINNDIRNERTNKKDSSTTSSRGKQYHSSLWPMILNRPLNRMEYSNDRIFGNDDEDSSGTAHADIVSKRRASVVYYLLLHGVAMEYSSK